MRAAIWRRCSRHCGALRRCPYPAGLGPRHPTGRSLEEDGRAELGGGADVRVVDLDHRPGGEQLRVGETLMRRE